MDDEHARNAKFNEMCRLLHIRHGAARATVERIARSMEQWTFQACKLFPDGAANLIYSDTENKEHLAFFFDEAGKLRLEEHYSWPYHPLSFREEEFIFNLFRRA